MDHIGGMAVDVTDIDKNRSTEMNQPPTQPVFLKEEKIITELQLPDITFNSNCSETILISPKSQLLKLVIRLTSLGYKILSTLNKDAL